VNAGPGADYLRPFTFQIGDHSVKVTRQGLAVASEAQPSQAFHVISEGGLLLNALSELECEKSDGHSSRPATIRKSVAERSAATAVDIAGLSANVDGTGLSP
jgi:hypothetical protein